MKRSAGVILALSSGVLWGLVGIFVRRLSALGLGPLEIGELRIFWALLATSICMLCSHRDLFALRLRDLWCFVGSGVFSVLLFCYTNYMAMRYIPISVATILVSTSPLFVMLLSALLFKERITKKIVISMFLTFSGCALVCGTGSGESLSPLGVALGLISGFVFSLYSIFSRFAIRRGYCAWNITFYSFFFCVAVGAFFCDWPSIFAVLSVPERWLEVLGLGICCGFAPYVLYGMSLEHIRSSTAAMLSSVEPVVATLVSVWMFHEPFGGINLLGILLVLASVFLLSRDS